MGDIQWLEVVIMVPCLIFALSVHEAAHAASAKWGGDPTAHHLGRVTLNPLAHIDPIGTVLVPILGALSGIPLIGWAKPVPAQDFNYTKGPSYGVVVAMAGPFSNLLIALFSAVLLMFLTVFVDASQIPGGFHLPVSPGLIEILYMMLFYNIAINIGLMCFNLIPIPPLDGSWLLWYGLVRGHASREAVFLQIRNFGTFVLLALLWTGVIDHLYRLIVFPITYNLIALSQLPLGFGQ